MATNTGNKKSKSTDQKKDTTISQIIVQKPTPYTFDLGLLLVSDPNPLLSASSTSTTHSLPIKLHAQETELASTARDGAQALINQLLSTCPITSSPDEGVLLSLPKPEMLLPREKPIPIPKDQTKWQKFAAKKGISRKTSHQRNRLVYDEVHGKGWIPKWGYHGQNKLGEQDWIVEVDDNKNKDDVRRQTKEGTEYRGEGRRQRKERVKRNERLQRANERRAHKRE